MMTICGKVFRQTAILAACLLPLWSEPVLAERIKDLASIQGIRSNQLIGYGIVVGLDNTGDQTTQTPFTTQAMSNMLSQLGINLTQEQSQKLQLKNVAAVMVTTSLPAFSQPGQAYRCDRFIDG
jgi:flagellar P-ring protein precursor FlgI